MDEKFCQPATALLCTLKMQPSTPALLNSSKFFFGQLKNLTAVFHSLSEHDRSTESNFVYPIFHVTLEKKEVESGSSRIVDVRSLLQRAWYGPTPEKPFDGEFPLSQSCIAQPTDPRKQVAPSVATNRASNLSCADNLDPTAGDFRPASFVPQSFPLPNQFPANAQINLSHQGVAVGPQVNRLRSPNSVSVAATQPLYRAMSQIPTQPRFVPNQSPVMATPPPAYQPFSPQVPLGPPGMTNSGDIESFIRASQNFAARSLNAIAPPGSAQNSVNTVAPTAMKSAVKVPDSQIRPAANHLPVSVQSEGY